MAPMSFIDTSEAPYRDDSPSSPRTPQTPDRLARWLRPVSPQRHLVSNRRLKSALLVTCCFFLGWAVTGSFGPGYAEDTLGVRVQVQAPQAKLSGPPNFQSYYMEQGHPGILSTLEEDSELVPVRPQGSPSVSGAISDLHHAVSSKIKSWNPYFVKGAAGPKYASLTTTNSSAHSNASVVGSEIVREGISEDDRLGAKIRIGKCTVVFGHDDYWERCIRTHERHDQQHGYRLHVLRQELMDGMWSKPTYILSLLLRELSKPKSERLDWLFWVDSDTIIMNPLIPIETFLPPPGTEFDDVYLVYSKDWNGLNDGVFPIRVNQWAVNLFAAIVSWRHWRPEVELRFHHQSAMEMLMEEPEFAKHVIQAPQRWFNAYQGEANETLQPFQIRRGDLLVHFAGVVPKEERMQFWLERAEQHLDEWEIPVKATSYPEEAKEFWRIQRALRADKVQKIQSIRIQAETLIAATDQKLTEYGDRLAEEQRNSITQQKGNLKRLLDDEKTKDDEAKLQEGMRLLTEAAVPLQVSITDANKVLLQSAHEAIFNAEHELLESKVKDGEVNTEAEQVSNAIHELKLIVMTPQDTWNRQTLEAATKSLAEARTRLTEKNKTEAIQQQALEQGGIVAAGASPTIDQTVTSTQTSSGESLEQTGEAGPDVASSASETTTSSRPLAVPL